MLPPGPRQPSALQLISFVRRPLEWLEACGRRYGDPFTARIPGHGTFVFAAAPGLIKQIFTGDDALLHAGKANAMLEPLVGRHSVLLLDGAPHLRQRRLLSPPLRGERMHAYAGLIAEIAAAEVGRMPRDRPFALQGHMQAITLEVILRAVFGVAEGAQMSALRKLVLEVLEPPPALLVFVPPKYLDVPLSPFRRFLRRRAALARALGDVVAARRAGGGGGTDILSLLLAARDEDGQPMSDEELVDELVTMLVAGHETTATALSWTFACMLQDPPVEARLRDEIAGAAGDPAALAALPWLDAVIKETLRLRPIVPDVVRRLQAPMRFAGFDLPAGVHLAPCIHLAHRRPDVYPEPDRFRPERFLGLRPDPYAWLPFGGGIRRCLGMAFALYEMKIVVGVVLARLRLELERPGTVRVVRRSVTLAPGGGTRVRVAG
ncbi:MAG TPA: cytochrome P450 [Kofleriaceae bacterium]|nr:cytochrome P450 [Kofleriaceae bacterium]